MIQLANIEARLAVLSAQIDDLREQAADDSQHGVWEVPRELTGDYTPRFELTISGGSVSIGDGPLMRLRGAGASEWDVYSMATDFVDPVDSAIALPSSAAYRMYGLRFNLHMPLVGKYDTSGEVPTVADDCNPRFVASQDSASVDSVTKAYNSAWGLIKDPVRATGGGLGADNDHQITIPIGWSNQSSIVEQCVREFILLPVYA